MTQLLQQAITAVEQLPRDAQDEIARLMLSLAGNESAEQIDPAHLADVQEALSQAERGDFATPEAVASAFRRFG